MHVESTITGKVYKFDLLKEESTTIIQGFVWRCFVKDYHLGANDIIKFEISVNLYFSHKITPCDQRGDTKEPATTREYVELEEGLLLF
jgi:hypothetical protein